MVYDYQEAVAGTAVSPLSGAALTTQGIDPPIASSSGIDGTFTLDDVPPGSVLYVDAAPGTIANYLDTLNPMVTIAESSLAQDMYLVSQAYTDQNFASTGVTATADTSIAIVMLMKNNGDPFTGVALADITLVDALDAPVAGVSGPYFFGAGNTMDPAETTSALYFNQVRAGFLNVPPGNWTMKLNYIDGQGNPQTMTAPIMTVAGGATVQMIGGMGAAPVGGGGGGGTALTFTGDIYPDLQRASAGGLSCAACHTAAGTNPNLQFDLPAAQVYAAVTANGPDKIVNSAQPDQSLILTKPLYENPADHPNATFATIDNAFYQKWMLWISQGAVQ